MLHTRSYIARKLLKSYRIARKQYNPRLARWHAYFRHSSKNGITNLQVSNLCRKYTERYWGK